MFRPSLPADFRHGLLGGRVAIADWLDAAGDWGASDMGGELRAGSLEGAYRLPFAFLLAGRTDQLELLPAGDHTGQQHALRARLEVYPSLPSSAAMPLI